MAISEPVSDTSRAVQHDPDQSWPASVVLQVTWHIDGLNRTRTAVVSADQFFGRGEFGAPMPGDALINMIEQMRRAGPPALVPKIGPPKHVEKSIPGAKRRAAGRDGADRKDQAVRRQRKDPS
jgi:hypothetical protein